MLVKGATGAISPCIPIGGPVTTYYEVRVGVLTCNLCKGARSRYFASYWHKPRSCPPNDRWIIAGYNAPVNWNNRAEFPWAIIERSYSKLRVNRDTHPYFHSLFFAINASIMIYLENVIWRYMTFIKIGYQSSKAGCRKSLLFFPEFTCSTCHVPFRGMTRRKTHNY